VCHPIGTRIDLGEGQGAVAQCGRRSSRNGPRAISEDVPDHQRLGHPVLTTLARPLTCRQRSPILDWENAVLPNVLLSRREETHVESSAIDHLADRAVERTVAGRRARYGEEMRRIVDVTFTLIERTGSLDPSMREILAEAGLSTQAFYRYFSSKDELMLALLDEGRGRLVGTLQRRMARATGAAEQVRAWIEGVLAQATNGDAAARTRPWVLSEQRLAELFPREHEVSVERLVGLLREPIGRLRGESMKSNRVASAATLVYRLVFATLRDHLTASTRPDAKESEALVAFCLLGVTA
jgi:AcrR family transcriptional regulator